jgi:hypothetical protein
MVVRLSIRMEQLGHTEQIFIKFDIWRFFLKYIEKIQVSLISDKNDG